MTGGSRPPVDAALPYIRDCHWPYAQLMLQSDCTSWFLGVELICFGALLATALLASAARIGAGAAAVAALAVCWKNHAEFLGWMAVDLDGIADWSRTGPHPGVVIFQLHRTAAQKVRTHLFYKWFHRLPPSLLAAWLSHLGFGKRFKPRMATMCFVLGITVTVILHIPLTADGDFSLPRWWWPEDKLNILDAIPVGDFESPIAKQIAYRDEIAGSRAIWAVWAYVGLLCTQLPLILAILPVLEQPMKVPTSLEFLAKYNFSILVSHETIIKWSHGMQTYAVEWSVFEFISQVSGVLFVSAVLAWASRFLERPFEWVAQLLS